MIFWMLFPFNVLALEETSDTLEENDSALIVTLEDCVDGDTAKFRTKDNVVIKARMLAIDTPETVHPTKGVEPFGKEASEYTCTTLTEAKEIKLEYDLDSNEEDNYGRKLVWVFVDGVLLQDSLVSKGYAEVAYLYGDYKYTAMLQDSQEVAKANKVGIWSSEDKEVEEETNLDKEDKTEANSTEKGFIDQLIDDMVAAIFDFIDELLESILKSIEDML